MNESIEINARYRMEPILASVPNSFNVIDRALEYNFKPAVVFSNGTEAECREWVLRNCEEPVEYTNPPRWDLHLFGRSISLPSSAHQDHRAIIVVEQTPLLLAAPKLLALLEQYHSSFPTKESGKLIAEARGWQIQE